MLALCSLIYMFIQVVDLAFLPASADYALVAAYTYLWLSEWEEAEVYSFHLVIVKNVINKEKVIDIE